MGAERSVLKEFRRYFWQPPRAHGEAIEDRTVSFLELFYDLVYVVVIARAAHHLAGHVSWEGAADFAIVFGLIWIGWLNGTTYHDLHARDDGRSRSFIFLQMLLLALLAVFTGEATGDGGVGFALTYAAFFGVLTYQWWAVRRVDRSSEHGDQFDWITARYTAGMAVSTVVFVVSAAVPEGVRRWMWIGMVIVWPLALVYLDRSGDGRGQPGLRGGAATDSLIERFGLFTIIVLGEVVVGAVEGMSEGEHTAVVVVTGLLGLTIGFAYWWTYFDFIGGRKFAESRGSLSTWVLGHLPVTASIAASGAAMVGIVEHAGDDRTQAASAWLLSGSVAIGLFALVWIIGSLEDSARLPHVYRPLKGLLVLAALFSLLLAWVRPAPWLFVGLIWAALSLVWFLSVIRWFGIDDGEAVPGIVE